MNSLRRRARLLLGALAAVSGVACCALLAALFLDQPATADPGELITAAWVCGIATVLLAVAAVQEHADPDDDPRYLQTIVHGFVDEWRR